MSYIKLREYQKEAVKFAIKVKKSLFCMRVGSGKTLCAIFSLRKMFRDKIINKAVISCTLSSTVAFMDDFKEVANIDIKLIEKAEDFINFLKGTDKICLIKHHMFDKLGSDLTILNEIQDIIEEKDLKIALALDEAHNLQSVTGVTHEAFERVSFMFERMLLFTATPYSSCLSQFYGLIHLVYPKLWRNKTQFFNLYIDEEYIRDYRTHRIVRKEKIRYKNLKHFRGMIEGFTYFYYPTIPLVHVEHYTELRDYSIYDDLCKGLLSETETTQNKEDTI